ncbi:MAG: protein kinase [Acidobacteria bacterium]|nr:protein kinase [Acidobacteriota bacterium]
MIGKTISHFKVLEKIGQGGMGEVYRAEDTNLSREVAIKVLPEQFTKDPQRLARFEREAKLLASLNHPNIAAIHSFEHADDIHFLVLELVPGDTLAERVTTGPLSVEESLEICRQIAEGVEAAHEKGVIHRDLKPANVKVTPEGKVKILDFGLAKAFEAEPPVADISQSPTLTEEMTRAGVILGTAAYMSPEQAKGKPVDKRADIFAFGAVLYELLTAKRAFGGETITETLGAIIHKEPDWDGLPENTPGNIRNLLRRCLQKDRHRRFRDAADVRIEVEEALSHPLQVDFTRSSGDSRPSRRSYWSVPAAVGAFAFLLGAGAVYWFLQRPVPAVELPTGRFVIDLGPDQHFPYEITGFATGAQAESLAISPDGKHVVYVAAGLDQGQTQLYLRTIDRYESRPIPDTEGASDPFFSPDSQWLGFLSGSELKKVALAGGSPVSLCTFSGDVPVHGGLTWGESDLIVFGRLGSGLWQVPGTGGEPQPLTTLDSESGETFHRDPQFLPGGEALLFHIATDEGQKIRVLSVETGDRKEVLNGMRPRYASSGHIVFQREESLYAVPFDVDSLEVTGSPVPLPHRVRIQSRSNLADFAFSDTGTLVYRLPTQEEGGRKLVWVDRQGQVQPLTEIQRRFEEPRLSPDGSHVAVTVQGLAGFDVWIYEFARGILTPLTFDGGNRAIWTPDGQRLTFSIGQGNSIFWTQADGSGEAEPLLTMPGAAARVISTSWSSQGVLAYAHGIVINQDIWVMALEGEREPQPFLVTEFNERHAMFSPDGSWVALTSNRSGQDEIYLKPYPAEGGLVQISTDGGVEPVWARSGRELFYRNQDKLMAVSIQTEPTFKAETPRLLFEDSYRESFLSATSNYDVTADGQRFVMVQPSQERQESESLNIVLNWFEELKRLVPAE